MTADTATVIDRPRFGAARTIVLVVLGLIAAWFLWDGIGNLVNLPPLFEQLDVADRTPWTALWLGALHPVVLFGLMAGAARRASVGAYALVLIATLGAIACLRLSLIVVATSAITTIPA